jgi:hypothetical protein
MYQALVEVNQYFIFFLKRAILEGSILMGIIVEETSLFPSVFCLDC